MITTGVIEENQVKLFKYDLEGKLKFFRSKKEHASDFYSNFVMLVYGINKKLFGNQKYSLIDFAKDVKNGIEALNPVNGFRV